jgi:redox-sensitive bicupin YhaK (pirin superfamily)
MPAMADGKLLGFQLWINMPASMKMNKPKYDYIKSDQIAEYRDEEKKINLIAGQFNNVEGPVKGHNVEPIYFDVELRENKKINLDVPKTHNSFIYLLKGDLKIGSSDHKQIKDSTLVLLERGTQLEVQANKKSKFLFIAGKPICEPIARGGPFVMNTKQEILQAIQDYNNGTFAKY